MTSFFFAWYLLDPYTGIKHPTPYTHELQHNHR